MPELFCFRPPLPDMSLPTVTVSVRLKVSVPLSTTVPLPSVPVVPPLPTCSAAPLLMVLVPE